MIRKMCKIAIFLFFFVDGFAYAQSANIFFSKGAELYTKEKSGEARKIVENGLEKYPDNLKLQKLMEKLKEQEQQQNQDQNQDQQDQQDQKDQNQQQNQENQQDQNEQENQENQQNQDRENQQQSQNQDQQDQGQEGQQQNQQANPQQMTPEEAVRILNAMKAREEESQKRRKVKFMGRRYEGNAW